MCGIYLRPTLRPHPFFRHPGGGYRIRHSGPRLWRSPRSTPQPERPTGGARRTRNSHPQRRKCPPLVELRPLCVLSVKMPN